MMSDYDTLIDRLQEAVVEYQKIEKAQQATITELNKLVASLEEVRAKEYAFKQTTIDRQQSCIRHRDEQHNTLVAIGLDKDATITELTAANTRYRAALIRLAKVPSPSLPQGYWKDIAAEALKVVDGLGVEDYLPDDR